MCVIVESVKSIFFAKNHRKMHKSRICVLCVHPLKLHYEAHADFRGALRNDAHFKKVFEIHTIARVHNTDAFIARFARLEYKMIDLG